jgi:hypothetical protein
MHTYTYTHILHTHTSCKHTHPVLIVFQLRELVSKEACLCLPKEACLCLPAWTSRTISYIQMKFNALPAMSHIKYYTLPCILYSTPHTDRKPSARLPATRHHHHHYCTVVKPHIYTDIPQHGPGQMFPVSSAPDTISRTQPARDTTQTQTQTPTKTQTHRHRHRHRCDANADTDKDTDSLSLSLSLFLPLSLSPSLPPSLPPSLLLPTSLPPSLPPSLSLLR